MNSNVVDAETYAPRDTAKEEQARRAQEAKLLFQEIEKRCKTVNPQAWEEITDEVRKRIREKKDVQLSKKDKIKLQVLKAKLKLTKKEEKLFDFIYRHTPNYLDDFCMTVYGGACAVAGLIGGIVSKFAQTGWTIKQWERDAKYFNDHPEMLEKAKEALQTDDLNAIIGFVNGSDGAAQELYYSLGLKDYYFNANLSSFEIGVAIAAGLFALPIVARLANAGSEMMGDRLARTSQLTEAKIEAVENTGLDGLMDPVMQMKNRAKGMKWHSDYKKAPSQETIDHDVEEVCQILKI